MPRPMRLAAPVTRITFPAKLDGWLAMNLDLFAASTPSRAGSGNRPVKLAHAQKKAVVELRSAGDRADQRGL